MSSCNPKVSIVIPVYNGANYLREAIDSALSQTYPEIEIIVVNDGSTDGGATEAIALSYGERIRYFYKENGGVSSALNVGINVMTGDYFSWLSHDDLYYPEKISTQVDYLQKISGEVILYGHYEFIDPTGKHLGERIIRQFNPKEFRRELIVGDPVNGCTVLIPHSCFARVGRFDERLRTIQDYDMWFRLAKDYRFVLIPQVLVKSRKHPEQGTYTIPGNFDSCSATYINFVKELSEEEIRNMSDEPLMLFYTKLALAVKLRGYTPAADVCIELADRYSRKSFSFEYLKFLLLRLFYEVLSKRLKPRYWFDSLKSPRR